MEEFSQRQRVIEHVKSTYGTNPEFLWKSTPEAFVFRHPGSKKWFGIVMTVPREKLGLKGEESVSVINVKCDPLLVGSLLMEAGFLPAYHMNKTLWISILLDETVADEKIFSLAAMSYESVMPKQKRRRKKDGICGMEINV